MSNPHHDHTEHDYTRHDHAAMGHMQMDHGEMDHGEMDHSSMGDMDHMHMGHGGHGDHVAQFRRLFWIMLVFAVPVVAFNDMFAHLIGYHLPESGWTTWISPVLGTVMYVWGGRPFLSGAVDEIRSRKPGMMLLIALAITVAFLASWGASSACSTRSSTSGGSWRC